MKKHKSYFSAPGIKSINDEAAEIWDFNVDLLFKKNRLRNVVEARQILMDYYDKKFKKEQKRNTEVMATALYNKDRTSIYHARRTIDSLLNSDKTFTEKYNLFYKTIS